MAKEINQLPVQTQSQFVSLCALFPCELPELQAGISFLTKLKCIPYSIKNSSSTSMCGWLADFQSGPHCVVQASLDPSVLFSPPLSTGIIGKVLTESASPVRPFHLIFLEKK